MTSALPLEPELDRWIANFRGPLVGLLASWGADWQSAEELAMDSFAEAWLGRDRMRRGTDELAAVGAYLRGIAQNLWRARRRGRERSQQLPAELQAREPANDERRELLRRAFALLHPEQQEVLRMHYLEQTTAREVAALLGTTQRTVEMRLYRARRALKQHADRELRQAEVIR